MTKLAQHLRHSRKVRQPDSPRITKPAWTRIKGLQHGDKAVDCSDPFEAELMHAIFPHPTLSEMMHESVLDAYGRAIHF